MYKYVQTHIHNNLIYHLCKHSCLYLLSWYTQAKLEKLNSIVWPEIWQLAEEKIAQAHSDGHKVCVIDAAVMLNAGWQRHMHEVWVTIAPDTEVSKH